MEPRLAIKAWLAFQVIGKHVRPLLSLENVRGKRFSSETMYVVSFWGQLPKLFPIVPISVAYLYLEFAPLFLIYKVFLMLLKKWEIFRVRVFEFPTDLELIKSTRAKG